MAPIPIRSWPATIAVGGEGPCSSERAACSALQLRREVDALGDGHLHWLEAPGHALVFAREPDSHCAVNLGAEPLPLDQQAEVLVCSGPLTETGALPQDTTAWLLRCETPRPPRTSDGS